MSSGCTLRWFSRPLTLFSISTHGLVADSVRWQSFTFASEVSAGVFVFVASSVFVAVGVLVLVAVGSGVDVLVSVALGVRVVSGHAWVSGAVANDPTTARLKRTRTRAGT